MNLFSRKILIPLSICATFLFADANTCVADNIVPPPSGDPHYTKVGFFDIHVCNWPDRKLFFMTLFSTYKYMDIAKIEVFNTSGEKLGDIPTDKYRIINKKGKPEKHVFISQMTISDKPENGWYRALITMKDGKKYQSKDYVVVESMGRATGMKPVNGTTLRKIPKKLVWTAIPGAKHYMVFIKDGWEERTIFTSKLLGKPEFVIPEQLLKPGGYYFWRIHARDVNENVLLGDFNHGSLNAPVEFSIAAD